MTRRPRAVAIGSLAVGILLVIAKLLIGLLTGSLAILSEAIHSLLDVVASTFAYFAVRTAEKPADHEHPFGHGRAENLSAFTEGILLILTAIGIGWAAVSRLVGGGAKIDASYLAMGLMVASMVIESIRGVVLRRVGKAAGSEALAADAANRGADVLSSLGVLAGLVAVRIGVPWADSVAALGVAGLILFVAARLSWKSGDILMDRSPAGVESDLRESIAGVRGVREVRNLRIRRSGRHLLGDASVAAKRSLSVEGAQQLTHEVRQAVARSNADVELTVVIESDIQADNMVERVHAAAARHGGLADLHNVTVEREADGSLHLTMHAKLPGHQSLHDARSTSSEVERALREEFPQVARVDIHLEPLEPDLVRGEDVTSRRADLSRRVQDVVDSSPDVVRCRDVELSARSGRITAHVVVEMAGQVTLEEAHAVETEIEARLRTAIPELAEVVVRTTA